MAAGKRWIAVARPAYGGWQVRVEIVGAVGTLLERLREEAAALPMLFGVDAPIGLPHAYAVRHALGWRGFRDFIGDLAPDSRFFSVCDTIDQVDGTRPFFPRTTGGTPRRLGQAEALGVAHPGALLRACDRSAGAASLFWTLGPDQVGKAALSLWRELLIPALRGPEPPALWPFEGELRTLLRTRRVTIAETYPAAALGRMRPRWRGSKRRQADRAGLAGEIGDWLDRLRARPEEALGAYIAEGFGTRPEAEDRFDCLLGLLGMLGTLDCPGDDGVPEDSAQWEGWILGHCSSRCTVASQTVASRDDGIASF